MGDAKSELSLTHREALDRLADEFERELRCANAPKIEDFIDREPAIRKQLLPELVAIEIELREYVGEQPIDEHYRNRFPNDWQQLQDLFVDRRRTATATIGVQPLVRVFGRQESSVLRSLQRTLPTIPRVMLKAAEQESATPIVRTKSTEMPRIELDLDGRYRIDGEIARGGMGAILKGRDTDLGRDLAIKVLLGSHQDDPAIIRRFIEEAQIGGQLQHPGIVPVYELGQFADRRPFISMKLVKGKTLAALLAERENVADDIAKLLGIFEQVCQTVAYAHSRGVIHRDLKPSNVMVGAFGEVQVMDWGLAKVLKEGGINDEQKTRLTQQAKSIIQTIRSRSSENPDVGSAGSETEMGSVLGTPAYMAPEQALGEIDILDQRTDVFGLGALLCEIVTGAAPYSGCDNREVFRKASRGKLEECLERLDAIAADTALVVLIRECLALEPASRPRDAGVVASRVTEHLESAEKRSRQAELERLQALTKATEERKRRLLTMALAAVALLAVGLGAWGLVAVEKKNTELARIDSDQQMTKLIEQRRLESQVRDELSEPRALLAESRTVDVPDSSVIRSAFASLERAMKLSEKLKDSPPLLTEIKTVEQQLKLLEKNVQLIKGLEEVWGMEMESYYAGTISHSYVSSTTRKNPWDPETRARSVGELLNPSGDYELSRLYEQAFLQWGFSPTEQPSKILAAQIEQLDQAIKVRVLVSLDRWRNLLESPRSYERCRTLPWSVLEPVSQMSRGGDTFAILDDKSILVSGDNPRFGYELVFETDLTSIDGFRLEAMLHDSLPNRGPGRGVRSGGVFAINELQLYVEPRGSSASRIPVDFRRVVADYAWKEYPLATNYWHIGYGGGKEHTAYFELDRPIRSATGFRVYVAHADRGDGAYGDENLGRFRWSATYERKFDERVRSIDEVIRMTDQDPWRVAMRNEAARVDVKSLTLRASDPDIVDEQPTIVLVQLAELLKRVNYRQTFSSLPTDIRWMPLQPIDWKLNSSAKMSVESDGTMSIEGPSSFDDTVSVTGEIDEEPITALRVDILRSPQKNGSRTIGRSSFGALYISEFQAVLGGTAVGEDLISLPFSQVFSQDSDVGVGTRLQSVIDKDQSTFYRPPGNHQEHQFVLVADIDPTRAIRDQLTLSVKTLGSSGVTKLRVFFTSDDLPVFPDPRIAATRLLQQLVVRNADNYWVNLSLAHDALQRATPDETAALRYASNALACRPNSVVALTAYLNSMSPLTIVSAEEVLEVGRGNVLRAKDLGAGKEVLRGVAKRFLGSSQRFSQVGEQTLSLAWLEAAQATDIADPELLKLEGEILGNLGEIDDAIMVLRKATQLDGRLASAHNLLGSLYIKQERFVEAAKSLSLVMRIAPTTSMAQSNYVKVLLKLERSAEVEALSQKILAEKKIHQNGMNNLAWALVSSDIEGHRFPQIASEIAELACSKEPARQTFWNTLGVARYYKGEYAKSIEALQRSVELSQRTDAIDLFFLAMAEWQLGHSEAAQEWLAKAKAAYSSLSEPELSRYRNEAEQLIESGDAEPAEPPGQAVGQPPI